jgi:G3E family GTPase
VSLFGSPEREARLPVAILTGFLGSGKTTLLNRMLRHPSMADTAVIVNEIGAVGLDQYFLDEADSDVVMLSNGCLCCMVRDDLEDTVSRLYARRTSGELPAFRRLVIETTGLADPGPVMESFLANPMLSRCFELACVATTVDVPYADSHLDEYYEAVRQVAMADRILITKDDLATTEQTASVEARLRRVNPSAEIVRAADASPSLLIEPAAPGSRGGRATVYRQAPAPTPRAALAHGSGGVHEQRVASFTLTLDEPLEWRPFADWLRALRVQHGDRLLRLKGILNVRGEALPISIHGVHHILHPPLALRAWPWEDHRSRLVFVTDGLSQATVEAGLTDLLGRIPASSDPHEVHPS